MYEVYENSAKSMDHKLSLTIYKMNVNNGKVIYNAKEMF